MFNVSILLLNDASKMATPLTNGAINQTLQQFATSATIAYFSWLTVVNRQH